MLFIALVIVLSALCTYVTTSSCTPLWQARLATFYRALSFICIGVALPVELVLEDGSAILFLTGAIVTGTLGLMGKPTN